MTQIYPFQIYPFIDIAVLDGVRERLSAGHAICVLTPELDSLIWANASGARMIGFVSRDEGIGSQPEIGAAARRQILGTPPGRKLAVRLALGVSSRLAIIETVQITLPGGEPALLLAEPAAQSNPETIIEGLDGDGSHAGVFGPRGELITASTGLSNLGIDNEELARLADEVSLEKDRMVKRRIKTAFGYLPAGAGRIGDDPTQWLLLVVEADMAIARQPARPDVAPQVSPNLPSVEPQVKNVERWYFSEESTTFARETSKPSEVELDISSRDHLELIQIEDPESSAPQHVIDEKATNTLFDPDSSVQDLQRAEVVAEAGTPIADADDIDLTAIGLVSVDDDNADAPYLEHEEMPVRFAWRIDADGKFSDVSAELARAVGPHAADIVGRTFTEVACAFAMNPTGEISELLDRRDTWSGRVVLWPLEGTDMRAPVELAALPIYGRDRSFEGFKGFGIVRLADATPDPEAIGLSFGRGVLVPEEEPSWHKPTPPDDPWKGEKPALKIAGTPAPRQEISDSKIIRLEERRTSRTESVVEQNSPATTLSPSERNAFHEIAERLRGDEVVPEFDADEEQVSGALGADPETDIGVDIIPADVEDYTLPPSLENLEPEMATDSALIEALPDDIADDIEEPAVAAAKYEQMLRDLIETVDKPILPDDAIAAENPTPPAAKYAEMFRDILDSIEEPPLDQRMIPVRPAEEILREAEEHHRQDVEDQERSIVPERLTLPIDDIDVQLESEVQQHAPDETPFEDELGSPLKTPGQQTQSRPMPDTSILMRLPAPVMIYGGKRVHFANPAFLEATGYGSAAELEMLGGIDQLIAGEADTDTSDRIGIRIRGNGIRSFSAIIRSVPWDETPAMMLTIRDSEPSSNVRALPLSEQERLDLQELRQEAAELSSILDTATDGVVILSASGDIRSLNHSAEALFGFNPAEITGKPFSLLLATESQRSVNDYISGLAGNGVASIMNDGREVIGREAHGRFIPLFLTIGHLPDSDGYCAVLRDMTQWKRAEEELIDARRSAEQASATKTEFLTRVSHEIRTPLNAIIGFSELMAEERFGPIGSPRYLDYAKDINRSGRHVLDLVNDLLDISKIEAGEQEMNFEAVALNDALSEAVALMQPQANRERVIIRSSFASTLPQVVADLRSIKQIALNLLSNAVRYTGAGGQVIISTAYELTGDVVIRVRDTGVGMSQQDLDQAMKPFKQLNTIKRGHGDGTGLGLPLTKALVEGNRAKFVITSTPGKGTMVEITFPSVRVLAS